MADKKLCRVHSQGMMDYCFRSPDGILESVAEVVNYLKMVQNTEIKMTYLIFVVFLSVLGVSWVFRAVFEF